MWGDRSFEGQATTDGQTKIKLKQVNKIVPVFFKAGKQNKL